MQNWIDNNGIHLSCREKKNILTNWEIFFFTNWKKILQDFKMYQLTINCSQKQTKNYLKKNISSRNLENVSNLEVSFKNGVWKDSDTGCFSHGIFCFGEV